MALSCRVNALDFQVYLSSLTPIFELQTILTQILHGLFKLNISNITLLLKHSLPLTSIHTSNPRPTLPLPYIQLLLHLQKKSHANEQSLPRLPPPGPCQLLLYFLFLWICQFQVFHIKCNCVIFGHLCLFAFAYYLQGSPTCISGYIPFYG